MAGQIPMLHFPARATGGHVDNTANRWQDTREIFSPNWVENWHPDMYRSFPSIYQEKTEWKIFSLMHIITCLVILQFLFTTTNIFQLLSIWDLICICCSIPWTNLRKNNIFNQMKSIFFWQNTLYFRMGPPSSLLLLVLIMFLMTCLGDYKEKRNPFVPAEPGSTPACAKLGTSFCEYVDDYPE